MFSILIFFLGLMVGWFFFPAPAWAHALYAYLVLKFPILGTWTRK